MYVDRHIHWLQATIKSRRDPREVFPLFAWRYAGRGFHGYQTRFVDTRSGGEIHTDSKDTAMGHHFVFSGNALAEAERWYAMDGAGIVSRFVALSARSSRIDLAINIHGGLITPEIVKDALKTRVVQPKAKTWRFIQGSARGTLGDTLYLGSPKSDVQIRVYDKNAESRIVSPEAWVRFEMQLRNARANAALYSCEANGIEPTIAGHFQSQLKTSDPEIQYALDGPTVAPVILPKPDSNRVRWLLGQVVQALAKECVLDDKFQGRFMDALRAEIERISDET